MSSLKQEFYSQLSSSYVCDAILPHIPEVYRLMIEEPHRNDLGYCGLPTLSALILLSIITYKGDHWSMIGHAITRTGYNYNEAEVQAILDHFEGDDPSNHLWRRKADGSYELLI